MEGWMGGGELVGSLRPSRRKRTKPSVNSGDSRGPGTPAATARFHATQPLWPATRTCINHPVAPDCLGRSLFVLLMGGLRKLLSGRTTL